MRHIPNVISLFRILLIPVFVWRMRDDGYVSAGLVLALSGLSDMLDGFLARRFGWTSRIGKVLDPAADKLTQVTVCIMLGIKMPRFWFFFGALLVKDLIMLCLGGWLIKKDVYIQGARWFGKAATALFYVVTAALIFFPGIPAWAAALMLGGITVLAFCAGMMYIPQFRSYRKETKAARPAGARAANKPRASGDARRKWEEPYAR